MTYPLQVSAFQNAIASFPDVYRVSSGIDCLEDITSDALSSREFGHLPHAAIRWADGSRADQAIVQFEFRLRPTLAGWRSLEFISWWVRDQARGDINIQLRPFALPPIVGQTVQLGHTLRFHIELFCTVDGDNLSPALATIQALADSLSEMLLIYQGVLATNEIR